MQTLIRLLALSLLFISQVSKSFALSVVRDTTLLTAFKPVNEPAIAIIQQSNVEFPGILTGNETQSMDYIEKFAVKRKNYLVSLYNKSKKLFPKAAAILKKYDVPEEFKVLLALESGFNANAMSPAGAVGYWQIMDNVAREYGLKISTQITKSTSGKQKGPHVIDDRKNFVRSTHAAAKYLQDRCRNLNNDWLLIAASYNCGIGNVWNAMQRTGKSNPTFWDIKQYLPSETSNYVMNFIALNVIFKNYEKFSANTLCFKSTVTQPERLNFDGINTLTL